MKPFDLEAAKRGEPILCDGEPCKFGAHIPEAKLHNRVIVIFSDGVIASYTEDGRAFTDSKTPSLTMAPKPKVKREGWVNVYRNKGDLLCGCVFNSEKEASELQSPRLIATVRIEWEEEA